MQKPSKKRIALKIVLKTSLIILLGLVVFAVQFTQNAFVWNSLKLVNLYGRKL